MPLCARARSARRRFACSTLASGCHVTAPPRHPVNDHGSALSARLRARSALDRKAAAPAGTGAALHPRFDPARTDRVRPRCALVSSHALLATPALLSVLALLSELSPIVAPSRSALRSVLWLARLKGSPPARSLRWTLAPPMCGPWPRSALSLSLALSRSALRSLARSAHGLAFCAARVSAETAHAYTTVWPS